MTYQSHVRLAFSGTLGTNNPAPEAFTFTMSIDRDTDLSQSQNDAVATAGVAFFADVNSNIAQWAVLTEVKSKVLLPSGLYGPGAPIISSVTGPGAVGATFHPPQIALAVGLQTTPRGPQGRFYVPAPCSPVSGADLLYDTTAQANFLTAVHTFLVAVNSAAGGGPGNANGLCVASGKGTGTNAIVSAVRVGRAFDTIRSRRRALGEAYVTSSF